MNQLIFNKSKKNRIKTIIPTSVLYIASVFYIISGISNGNFNLITGILLLFISFYLTYGLIFNRKSVTVSRQGIKAQTNGMRIIDWKFIDGFEIKKVRKNKFLIISISNHTELLNSQNKIVAALMKTNINTFGSPVVIVESEFHIPIEDAKKQIELFQQQQSL